MVVAPSLSTQLAQLSVTKVIEIHDSQDPRPIALLLLSAVLHD
jgi:hypothetical protein